MTIETHSTYVYICVIVTVHFIPSDTATAKYEGDFVRFYQATPIGSLVSGPPPACNPSNSFLALRMCNDVI